MRWGGGSLEAKLGYFSTRPIPRGRISFQRVVLEHGIASVWLYAVCYQRSLFRLLERSIRYYGNEGSSE